MKRWIASLAAAAFVCGLAWLGGYNFDERGEAAFLMALCAAFAAWFAFTYPGWRE